jgi:pantoate--beta-alanine ligase
LKIIYGIKEVRDLSKSLNIGFVPTMGALHKGHVTLIEKSLQENEETVVSIFINPTQFSPGEDYIYYPKTLEQDLEILKKLNVTAVFVPRSDEIYHSDFDTTLGIPSLENLLCGATRPGHFRGVCLILMILLNLLKPQRLYLGRKDFQQLTIIQKMCRDLLIDTEVIGCPIFRDQDGLPLSSRLAYLDPSLRSSVSLFPKALSAIIQNIDNGNQDNVYLKEIFTSLIQREESPFYEILYADFYDKETLQPSNDVKKSIFCAALMVKTLEKSVRLIDNIPFEISSYYPQSEKNILLKCIES